MSKKRPISEVVQEITPGKKPKDFSSFKPLLTRNRAIYFKPDNPQCKEYSGTFYHINYNKFNEEKSCLTDLQNKFYFENEQISSAPNGVYTWVVLLKHNRSTPKIIACRILSTHEIGTKHANLLDYFRMKLENPDVEDHTTEEGADYMEIMDHAVLGAGEFIKDGETIKFNLFSGTYMREKIKNETMLKKVQDDMETVFKTFTGLTIVQDTTNSGTYITEDNIKLKKEDLLILLKCGAKIRKFETLEKCLIFDSMYGVPQFESMNGVPKFENVTEESLQNWIGGNLELVKHKRNRQTKRRKRAKRISKSRRNKSSR